MFRSRSHLQSMALWLALAGVALRSLVPVGFMPGWTDAAAGGGARWLIICPTSPLYAALQAAPDHGHEVAPAAAPAADHAHHAAEHHDHAAMLAAQAAAAAADPHAHHHHGAAGDAEAAASPSAVAVDPHAGHDASQHGGHRIAAEHLSCPFAGAAAPALPANAAVLAAVVVGNVRPNTAVPADAVIRHHRRLPPARAPPRRDDDTAAA